MWQDLWPFLSLLIPGALIGAVIGLLLRRYGRESCKRYAAWAAALPPWAYALFTVFFVMLAASQFTMGRPTFGTGFAVFAVLELIAMTNAFRRKAPPRKSDVLN